MEDLTVEMAESFDLSEREAEVFGLLSQGYSAETISEKLVISYHTARSHIRNVYKKLDVHSHKEMMELRDEEWRAYCDRFAKAQAAAAADEDELL